MASVAAIAFILFQISVAMTPMPVAAVPLADPVDPCSSMMMDASPMDMGSVHIPDHDPGQPGNAGACPLLKVGGCFALCATVVPALVTVEPLEGRPLALPSVETVGQPRAVPPPQRPPRPI